MKKVILSAKKCPYMAGVICLLGSITIVFPLSSTYYSNLIVVMYIYVYCGSSIGKEILTLAESLNNVLEFF